MPHDASCLALYGLLARRVATSEFRLEPAGTLLDALLGPRRTAHGSELHDAAVPHLQLVLLLGVDLLLVALADLAVIAKRSDLLGKLGLTLDTVVGFVAAGINVSMMTSCEGQRNVLLVLASLLLVRMVLVEARVDDNMAGQIANDFILMCLRCLVVDYEMSAIDPSSERREPTVVLAEQLDLRALDDRDAHSCLLVVGNVLEPEHGNVVRVRAEESRATRADLEEQCRRVAVVYRQPNRVLVVGKVPENVAVFDASVLRRRLVLVLGGAERELLRLEVVSINTLDGDVAHDLDGTSVPAEPRAREVSLDGAEEEGDVGAAVSDTLLEGEEAGDFRGVLEQVRELDGDDTENRVLLASTSRLRVSVKFLEQDRLH
jgi:hypothetical protein